MPPTRPPHVTTSRGRPAIVSRDEVISAAVRVARRVGLPSLTMALVANELDVAPMTAYYHVANKQELLDLVVDAVLAQVEIPPAAAGDWKKRLTILHGSARQELSQVKGVGHVIWARGATPQAARLAGSVVEILREAGFDDENATLAFDTIFTYMTGQLEMDNAASNAEGSTRADLAALTTFQERRRPPSADHIFDYGFETLLMGLQARLAAGPGAIRPR